MYTPAQASDMLKIPPSTLRRYVAEFAEHLSQSATQQRSRRFTEQDIALLGRARELLNSGNSPQKTNSLLAVNTEQPTPESTLALIPSLSQALTEALDTSRALRAQVNELQERQAASESEQAELKTALSALQDRLSQLEHEQALSWYQRLFRRSK